MTLEEAKKNFMITKSQVYFITGIKSDISKAKTISIPTKFNDKLIEIKPDLHQLIEETTSLRLINNNDKKYKDILIKYFDFKMIDMYTLCQYIGNDKDVDISQIDNAYTKLADDLFMNTNIENVNIQDNIFEIPKQCFKGSDLKTINLSKDVKVINEKAFCLCKNLKYINIDNVEYFEKYAFSGSGIESIKFNNNITNLPEYICAICPDLKDVELPNNIKSIGAYSFSSTGIETIDCKNIVEIGYNAFEMCEELENVSLLKAEILKSECFLNCKKLKLIELNNVKDIAMDSFKKSKIETLILNSPVKIRYGLSECEIKYLIFNKKAEIAYSTLYDSKINYLVLNEDDNMLSFTGNNNIHINNLIVNGNTQMYATSLRYSKIANLEVHGKLDILGSMYIFKENLQSVVINAFNNQKFDFVMQNCYTTYKELQDKDFETSKINQILKAQNEGLLLSSINNDISLQTIRDLRLIFKRDKDFVNKLKLFLCKDDFTLDDKIFIEKAISLYLNKNIIKENDEINR